MTALDAPRALDLSRLEPHVRSTTWAAALGTAAAGLQLADPLPGLREGAICADRLALGQVCLLTRTRQRLHWERAPAASDLGDMLSVVIVHNGQVGVTQEGRRCVLRPGLGCLIDGRRAVNLDVAAKSSMIVLHLPREMVVLRHRHIERQTSAPFDARQGGASLLHQMVVSTLAVLPALGEISQLLVMNASIELVGIACAIANSPTQNAWRVQRALADIEARIRDASLCARQIADSQSISRRRLDALFVHDVGTTITKSILHRRLDRARLDLRSSANAKQTITEIAFALGFNDAAHFSRAFKQKFAVTPTRWRQSGTGAEETSV